MDESRPELSVVLVVGDLGNRAGLERSLSSLTLQGAIDQTEVVVVDCGKPDDPPMRGSEHRSVHTIKLPRGTTTMADARAEGVRHARAPLVAFMDEHSFAMAGLG